MLWSNAIPPCNVETMRGDGNTMKACAAKGDLRHKADLIFAHAEASFAAEPRRPESGEQGREMTGRRHTTQTSTGEVSLQRRRRLVPVSDSAVH